MANIKSAKKRVLIAEANRQRNVAFKTSIKTALKKALCMVFLAHTSCFTLAAPELERSSLS